MAHERRVPERPHEIVVCFGVDAAYAPHLAVAIASVVANSRARFRFVVINDGIPEADRQKIESCAPGHAFEWSSITDDRLLNLPSKGHMSRASFYRFAIPDLAPADTTKAIYIDSDLVVLGDLADLHAIDLEGRLIGAVHDAGLDHDDFAQTWALDKAGRLDYFNAGVLLLDIEGLRKTNAFGPAVSFLIQHWDALPYCDQDVLNIFFWKKWKRLEPLWNVQRRMAENTYCASTPEENMSWRKPKIVHFTEKIKPWLKDGYHPFIWVYYRYLRRTPYWKDINQQAGNTPVRMAGRYAKTMMKLARLKP